MTGTMPPGPLSYSGQLSIPYITKNFAPNSSDSTFTVPTVWIWPGNSAWICIGKPAGSAQWLELGGPAFHVETITAGNSVVVVPDANNNITFLNGNGVATTGSGSDLTLNMASPFVGSFTHRGLTTLDIADTATNTSSTAVNILHTLSSGTPASGIGSKVNFQFPVADGTIIDAATIEATGPNATANDQTSQLTLSTNYIGNLTPRISVSTLEADARLANTGPNSEVRFNSTDGVVNTGFQLSYLSVLNFNPTSANLGAFAEFYVDNSGGMADCWIGFDFSGIVVNTFGTRGSDYAFVWASGLTPYPTPRTGPALMTLSRTALSFFGTLTPSQAESKSQAALTTTDATPTTIYTITLAANQMVRVFCDIQGTKSDWSAAIFGTLNAGARKVGAAAADLIGSPIVNLQTDSGGLPTFNAVVSGNTLLVQVTGVAAQTWSWLVTLTYSAVS